MSNFFGAELCVTVLLTRVSLLIWSLPYFSVLSYDLSF